MKVILEWDGDQKQLDDDQSFNLIDSIIWHLDYGEDEEVLYYNKIKITIERSKNGL